MKKYAREILGAAYGKEYGFYGIRKDTYRYNLGDAAKISHQLYQDQHIGDFGEELYPEGEGIYAGFYDAGELGGTCVIRFNIEKNEQDDIESVEAALELVKIYGGIYLTIIGGDHAELGNDEGEYIIEDARVIGVIDMFE